MLKPCSIKLSILLQIKVFIFLLPWEPPNINKLLLSYCDDKKLDVLIGTHGHGDHLGGFSNGALNNINSVGLIIDYGYADGGNSKTYESIRDSYVKLGAKYYSAYDCVNYTNGGQKKYKFSDDLSSIPTFDLNEIQEEI